MFTEDPKLAAVLIVVICFLVVLVVGVVLACCCKTRMQGLRRGRQGRSPCTKCQLIDMGEAACYTGYCPDCGNVPPSLRR